MENEQLSDKMFKTSIFKFPKCILNKLSYDISILYLRNSKLNFLAK